ncbi:MAG: peptidoglycan-binding domain-containing protein [Candidatus Paceibacterota bacterium]
MKKFVFWGVLIFMIFGLVFQTQAANLVVLNKQVGVGAKGESVMVLQNFLVSKGYLSGLVDGKFGPKTKAAVAAYQKANKIPQTGFVGPLTFAAINKAITNTGANTTNTTGTIKPLSIKNTSLLPTGKVGVEYKVDIEGVGGTAGYNWEIISGALPQGIVLTRTAIRCIMAPCYNWMPAYISGVPEVAGSYAFTIEVMSGDEKVQKNFTLEISNTSALSGGGSTTGNTGVVCEYARPPMGYHYENMHTNPPCGATLVAD